MKILTQNPQVQTAQNYKQQNQSFKANILIKSAEGILRFKQTPDLLIGVERKSIPEFGNIVYVKNIQTNCTIGTLGTNSKIGKLIKKISTVLSEAETDTSDKIYEILI